jgi:hypothetical protein
MTYDMIMAILNNEHVRHVMLRSYFCSVVIISVVNILIWPPFWLFFPKMTGFL